MNETLHPPYPILIVDDEEPILLSIDTTLRMAGMNNLLSCSDSRQVMDIFSKQVIEVLLMDLSMPHITGKELLERVSHDFPDVPVIVVTGAVDVDTAVLCMKSGAFDYVIKPVESDRLVTSVNRALAFKELKRENFALKQHILSPSLENPKAFSEIITNNKKMLSIFQYIESIAQSSQGVLIRGETGVGKELVARAIHRISGLTGQFVVVNVAGLDDNIFSDTLFGHVKGAFTGADQDRPGMIERASGGTLSLDEIGDLSPASQVKLLRLLQEGEYLPLGMDVHKKANARIITSTNMDLWALQKAGKFRKDLNYRLRTHRIYIPPLRERLDDIPLLTEHFLEQAARSLKKPTPSPPKELFTLLRNYTFPGNVRELQAMVFDAVSTHKSGILSLEAFKNHIRTYRKREHGEAEISEETSPAEDGDLIIFPSKLPTIKKATQLLVEEALKRADSNQSIAAEMLGISQQALSKRLKKKSGKGD